MDLIDESLALEEAAEVQDLPGAKGNEGKKRQGAEPFDTFIG